MHETPGASDPVVATRDRDPAAADERLAEAVRRLVQMFAPDRIYLFGSRARGDARPDSDWDLMVILPESAEPKIRRAQRAHLALAGVRLPVDILVWTRKEFDWQAQASASLPATILREGRVLYAA